MKTVKLLTFLILLSIKAFSQDTIFTIEDKIIIGKVAEVGSDQIKYKSSTDSERQFTWIARFEVAAIHYQNGEYEVFNTLTAANTPTNNNYNTAGQSNTVNSQNNDPGYYAQNNRANKVNNVIAGVRVVGFICRLALLFVGNSSHANSYSSGNSYHSDTHNGPRFSGSGNSRSH